MSTRTRNSTLATLATTGRRESNMSTGELTMRSWRIPPCDLKPGRFEMHVFFARLESLGGGARIPVRHAHEPNGRDRGGCPRCQELYLRTLVAVQRVLLRLLGDDGREIHLHQETPGRLWAGDT